jgi:hypothetical protein
MWVRDLADIELVEENPNATYQPKAKEEPFAADKGAGAKTQKPVPKAKLWAGLGVTRPAVRADDVTDGRFFMVSFALANDGDKTIDPEIGSTSQFLVNGKELKNWPHIINNGPRGSDFNSLPPRGCLQFGSAMGKEFTEPGVYRIQWKGKEFESAVVEFRVLPANK